MLTQARGARRQVSIQGLAGREYLDNLADKKRCKEPAPEVRFAGEVDRVYLDVPGPLRVRAAPVARAALRAPAARAAAGARRLRIARGRGSGCVPGAPGAPPAQRSCGLLQGGNRCRLPQHCLRAHSRIARPQIVDGRGKRTIEVAREGLPDAVVWNPWVDKAAGMADFADEEYQARPAAHVCLAPALLPLSAKAMLACRTLQVRRHAAGRALGFWVQVGRGRGPGSACMPRAGGRYGPRLPGALVIGC